MTLSALLGGKAQETDEGTVAGTFLDVQGKVLGIVQIGPVTPAVFVEPVGVDQPGRVVLRGGDDRLQEGFALRHGASPLVARPIRWSMLRRFYPVAGLSTTFAGRL